MPAAAPAPNRTAIAHPLFREPPPPDVTVICPVHETLVPSTVAEIGEDPGVLRATNWTAAIPSAPVTTFAVVPVSVPRPRRPTTAPDVSSANITPTPGTGF